MTLSRSRRALLAIVGIALAALAARPEVANGLVARGDDVAEAGNAGRAQIYYRRALAIDPSSSVALDRTAVSAMMQGNPAGEEDAVRRLRGALAHRSDEALLFDLALLQLKLHRYSASSDAFRHLRGAEPSALFAAAARIVARRSGEPGR